MRYILLVAILCYSYCFGQGYRYNNVSEFAERIAVRHNLQVDSLLFNVNGKKSGTGLVEIVIDDSQSPIPTQNSRVIYSEDFKLFRNGVNKVNLSVNINVDKASTIYIIIKELKDCYLVNNKDLSNILCLNENEVFTRFLIKSQNNWKASKFELGLEVISQGSSPENTNFKIAALPISEEQSTPCDHLSIADIDQDGLQEILFEGSIYEYNYDDSFSEFSYEKHYQNDVVFNAFWDYDNDLDDDLLIITNDTLDNTFLYENRSGKLSLLSKTQTSIISHPLSYGILNNDNSSLLVIQDSTLLQIIVEDKKLELINNKSLRSKSNAKPTSLFIGDILSNGNDITSILFEDGEIQFLENDQLVDVSSDSRENASYGSHRIISRSQLFTPSRFDSSLYSLNEDVGSENIDEYRNQFLLDNNYKVNSIVPIDISNDGEFEFIGIPSQDCYLPVLLKDNDGDISRNFIWASGSPIKLKSDCLINDINNDGLQDIIGIDFNGNLKTIINKISSINNFIQFDIPSRDYLSKVVVYSGNNSISKLLPKGYGHKLQNSKRVHFAFGDNDQIDSVEFYNTNSSLVKTIYDPEINSTNKVEIDKDLLTSFQKINLKARAYPQPFANDVSIIVSGRTNNTVQITILDNVGNTVAILQSEQVLNGTIKFYWDGRNSSNQQISTGVYYLDIRSGSESMLLKILKEN